MRLPKPNNIQAEKYVAGMAYLNRLAKIKLSANGLLGPSPKAKKNIKVSKVLQDILTLMVLS